MTAHLKHISSFLAMEVLARAQELEAQGRDIIHLEVGEPDFQAPSEALETVIKSLSKKPARYTHCLLYTSPSPRDATLSRMPSSA